MSITKYRSLTNEEFLSIIEEKAIYSDLFKEVYNRIDALEPFCPLCNCDITKYNQENK